MGPDEGSVEKFFDLAVVASCGEELGNAGGPGRVAEGGSDFGQRNKDESAIEHTRMWDLEIRRVDGFTAVEENVEVEEARTFGEGLLAAHLRFDKTKGAKEIEGVEFGLRFEDGVEEPILIEVIEGFGFVNA